MQSLIAKKYIVRCDLDTVIKLNYDPKSCFHCHVLKHRLELFTVMLLYFVSVICLLVGMGTTAIATVTTVCTLRMYHGMYSKPQPVWLQTVTARVLKTAIKAEYRPQGYVSTTTRGSPTLENSSHDACDAAAETEYEVGLAWRRSARALDLICFWTIATFLTVITIAASIFLYHLHIHV